MLRHIPFYASLVGRNLRGGYKAQTSHALVYGAIEAHAMGEHGCIASNKTIAAETGLAQATVSKVISQLNAAGWIFVHLDENNQRLAIEPLLTIMAPTEVEQPAPLSREKTPPFPQENPPLSHRKTPPFPQESIEYSNKNTDIKYSLDTSLVRSSDKQVSQPAAALPAEAHQIADELERRIAARLPHRKPKTEHQRQKAALEIERLHRIDGHDWKLIALVMAWSQQDDFWSQNILSTAKLRKQFDTLLLRMRAEQQRRERNIAFV